ncbi:MAG: hypothetical protein DKINENOH_02082 [bacterium]|nr:hypothetical protein [bacterium]MCK6558271.1 FemAB family PEP-CTERM system-associated protein [bacterium]
MIVEAVENQCEAWDRFVHENADSRGPHLSGWKQVIEKTFSHHCYYLAAREGDRWRGLLPLTHLRSKLFGSFLVSVPYLNYGGIVADSEAARQALYERAVALARQLRVAHVELRHETALLPHLPTKQHKVAMLLELPDTSELLLQGFKAKLRSQIRKPQKEGLTYRCGREQELDSFYQVFVTNMRDLGTPVYSRRFFANILAAFPERAHICTVYRGEQPLAAGFVFGFRQTLEIPWASSLREFNALAPNMLLYWAVLEFAIQQGYKFFDFGRSTPNEGTYKFKEQWGARPVPLHWQYWLANGATTLPDLSPHNAKYQMAIQIWQRLPLAVTRLVGPAIVKNIP